MCDHNKEMLYSSHLRQTWSIHTLQALLPPTLTLKVTSAQTQSAWMLCQERFLPVLAPHNVCRPQTLMPHPLQEPPALAMEQVPSLHDVEMGIILLLQAQLLPTGWATSITVTITG